MEFNTQALSKPFSRLFSTAFRVGSAVSQRSTENFLVPPRGFEDDDAVRVLFSSRGVFKADGKGETPAIEREKPKRDPKKESFLGKALGQLSSLTSDIQRFQENIEGGFYTTDLQKQAAEEEINDLKDEYKRIVGSEDFKKAIELVKKVRKELNGLSDEELYGEIEDDIPLVSENLNELSKQQNVSVINQLVVNLDKLLAGPDENASAETLDNLKDAIDKTAEIERGGKKPESSEGKFGLLLGDLGDTVKRLRSLRKNREDGLYSDNQLDAIKDEESELEARYKEIIRSKEFKEITQALENITALRNGKPGITGATNYAKEQSLLLGDNVSNLLGRYRFGELDELGKALGKISEAAEDDTLSNLNSDQLTRLAKTIDRAYDIVSGETLSSEEDPNFSKRVIDLNETKFEAAKKKLVSKYLDEIEDFLEYTEEDAKGAYTLIQSRIGGPPKSLNDLDIIA